MKPVALPVRYGGPAPSLQAAAQAIGIRPGTLYSQVRRRSKDADGPLLEPPRRARLMRSLGTAVMEAVSATEVGGPVTSTAPRSPPESS